MMKKYKRSKLKLFFVVTTTSYCEMLTISTYLFLYGLPYCCYVSNDLNLLVEAM